MKKSYVLFYLLNKNSQPEYKTMTKEMFYREIERFKRTGNIHFYDMPDDLTHILKPVWIGAAPCDIIKSPQIGS